MTLLEKNQRLPGDTGKLKKIINEKDLEIASLNFKLNQATRQIEELNESRSRLAFIISHDLRSPFNGLLGFTNFLADEIESLTAEEIKMFTANINSSAKGILELIDDLSEWARIENGTMVPTFMSLDLNYIAAEIFHSLNINAALKKITLINNIPPDTFATGDTYMINSVFRNLISNAIKFTNTDGTVSVGINPNDDHYEISVVDNGIGISVENLEKLFRIDKHFTTRGTANEKGTGLGLILCKKLLDKNNGTIRIISEVGKGTEVLFTLPKG